MAEYIDLDKKIMVVDTRGRKLETTVRHILDSNNGEYEDDVARLARHGRWELDVLDGTPGYRLVCIVCSECHRINYGSTPYCPNCGCKMDGGTDNG